MKESIDDQELHAYLDNQLPPARRLAVKNWLREHPEARLRMADYQTVDKELRQAYEPILNEPVPEHLRQLVNPPIRWETRVRQVAVVCFFTLLGGIGGWQLHASRAPVITAQMPLVSLARVSHQVYTPEVLHPVEVGRDQQAHLVGWLSKRLGETVRAPDLGEQGFTLVGGRLLPADQGPAAQFMYENTEGLRLTLYVRHTKPDNSTSGFRFVEADGLASFYWIDGPLGYALSAPLDRQQLLQTAQRVYHQLSL